MTAAEIKSALDLHGKWLRNEPDGVRANLTRANLADANLTDANLAGATMPDGRRYEEWLADPLEGICTEPEARRRAVAAWGSHVWGSCPMSAGIGIRKHSEAPEAIRSKVATFVALFDGGHLPQPKESDDE